MHFAIINFANAPKYVKFAKIVVCKKITVLDLLQIMYNQHTTKTKCVHCSVPTIFPRVHLLHISSIPSLIPSLVLICFLGNSAMQTC